MKKHKSSVNVGNYIFNNATLLDDDTPYIFCRRLNLTRKNKLNMFVFKFLTA